MPRIAAPLCCALALAGCLDSGQGTNLTGNDVTTAALNDGSQATANAADTATAAVDTAPALDTAVAVDPSEADTSACVALGGDCATTAQCCGDAFCPAEVSYFAGLCTAPYADGESCYTNIWCASGTCNSQSMCGALKCADPGGECWYDDACCSGACFYDVVSPYVPGHCGDPLPNGAACAQGSWCASGSCYDGTCAAPDCATAGKTCQGGWSCCTGLCSNEFTGTYGPGQCLDRLPAGSTCYADTWCASFHCDNLTCAEF